MEFMSDEALDWNSFYWRIVRNSRAGLSDATDEFIRTLITARHSGYVPPPYLHVIARAMLSARRKIIEAESRSQGNSAARQKIAVSLLYDLMLWHRYERKEKKRSKHAGWAPDAWCDLQIALAKNEKSKAKLTPTKITADIARKYGLAPASEDQDDHALAANLNRVLERNWLSIIRTLSKGRVSPPAKSSESVKPSGRIAVPRKRALKSTNAPENLKKKR